MITNMTSEADASDGFLSDLATGVTQGIGGVLSQAPSWLPGLLGSQQNQPGQATYNGTAGSGTTSLVAAASNNKMLLIGGAVAVGLLVLYLVMKK